MLQLLAYQRGGQFKQRQYRQFVHNLYSALKQELTSRGYNNEDGARLARFAVQQAAFESGYGTNAQAANYNYGGLIGGKNYGSYSGYAKAYYDMISEKWTPALKATNMDDYITAIHTNSSGRGIYSTTPVKTYQTRVQGVKRRVLDNLPEEYEAQNIQLLPKLTLIQRPSVPTRDLELPTDALSVKSPIIEQYVVK